MNILVINSGSSSIKYQLFKMPSTAPVCSGLIERIGLPEARISHKSFLAGAERKQVLERSLPNHEAGLLALTEVLMGGDAPVINHPDDIDAIGHRVVHGGDAFSATVLIDEEVKRKIKSLFALAPLHNPPNYQGIEVAERVFAKAKQVAVFDTAFHQSMAPVAYRMALPKAMYSDFGIRAYGFHGTSHRYVSRKAAEMLNNFDAKLITIHLGNGCSMTAIRGGRSVDTSMGLGPMAGLIMGTRPGDLDSAVIFHLINERGYDPKVLHDMLNKQSGLQGLCGHSDMRDLKQAMMAGDADAQLAYDMYAYRIRKYIGMYAAVLNGLDAIVFTAGVGENDADMRAEACRDMDFFGITLDAVRNAAPGSEAREVQSDGSQVKILVVPTNEELEIAQQTFTLLQD